MLAIALSILVSLPVLADVTINGHTVTEETGVCFGTFILPNELEPEQLVPVYEFEQGGTLISVGTFRTMIAASLGYFDRVIMLDHDRLATQFNNRHIELISAISKLDLSVEHQRYQYLAALNLYWFTKEELKGLTGDADAFKAALKAGIENANKTAIPDEASIWYDGDGYLQNRQWPPEEMPDSVDTVLSKIVEAFCEGGTCRQNMGRHLWDMEGTRFYWQQDGAWDIIVSLINGKKMTAINGSLTGNDTMKTLAEALEKGGEWVSNLDLSNAMDYLDLSLLRKNIRLLPLRETSAVTFTVPDHEKKFYYFGAMAKDFSKMMGVALNQKAMRPQNILLEHAFTNPNWSPENFSKPWLAEQRAWFQTVVNGWVQTLFAGE